MPVGDECQLPPEPALQAEGGGVEVEGGRERWEEGKRRSGRRKRKVTASTREYGVQEPQQVYSVNERDCEVDPTHQQQQMIQSDDLSLSTKRQCLEGYTAEITHIEAQQGHYEEAAGSLGGANIIMEQPEHDMYAPVSEAEPGRSGEEGEEEEEREVDLVSLMREEQAKVQELIGKCEEALSEGVEYETFFPVRIEEMLRAAHTLEQSLLEQKQAMKERLQEILGIL